MLAVCYRQGKHFKSLFMIRSFDAALRCCAFLVFLAPLFFAGCAVHQQSLKMGEGTYRILPDKYQKKALDYEAKELFPQAIQSWRIVLGFHPHDRQIKERINSLSKKSQAKAGEHFNKGVKFYKHGQFRDARREFLLTLAYDQNHDMALDYLKTKLQRPVFKRYVVHPGDTVKKIAARELHDPQKYILIMAFNDTDPSGELTEGTLLQIPLLGKDFLSKKDSAQVMPQYVVTPTEPSRPKNKPVSTIPPKNTPQEVAQTTDKKQSDATRDLANYLQARKFLEQEDYEKTFQMLLSVDIDFRDVRQLRASTEVFLQQEADAHYRKGISYFLSENLDKAIEEWEEVLRLRPDHLKAQKDLQNARKMQQRVKKY